jgi:choline dehydrogenase-like flavoprotein
VFVDPEFLGRPDLPPVVIIGSGPAGMTLAVSLAERRIPCLILEAGDRAFEPDIQDDCIGEVTGDPYFELDVTRLRQFGGSSNHWAGWCRPLDAWDFEPVPGLGIPGWPIAKVDLDPHASRANDILEIPDPVDRPINDELFEAQFVYSPPVNFGLKYEALIEGSRDLHVALRTAVTALHAEGGRISRVEIVDANGTARTLSPDIVVVAAGGIENSRLLLWSNTVSAEPVVAQSDVLGRYWMEHPVVVVGSTTLTRDLHQNPIERGEFSLSMNPERLVDHGALNAMVRLRYTRNFSLTSQIRDDLCNLEPQLLDLANLVTGKRASCGSEVIRVTWEQEPDAANRIVLSETLRDGFGNPAAHLMWRKTAQDYRTARVAFEMVATHIVANDAGLVRANPYLLAMADYPEDAGTGGHHHMGGTRMSISPADGIVDSDLRIHGMANAYVAGSSVFVRSGHANPTYTIVQLSLRLADHLATRLSG